MATGRYDTDAMRRGVAQLTSATDQLKRMTARLESLPHGTFAAPVGHALGDLGHRGKGVVDAIAEDGSTLASNLDRAATCYELLEQSMIERFRIGE